MLNRAGRSHRSGCVSTVAGRPKLAELLPELVGLVDVHLVADGLDRPEPGTQVGGLGRGAHHDRPPAGGRGT